MAGEKFIGGVVNTGEQSDTADKFFAGVNDS
jgi:hypothetical protein